MIGRNLLSDVWYLKHGAREIHDNPPGEIRTIWAYNPRVPFIIYLGEPLPDTLPVVGVSVGKHSQLGPFFAKQNFMTVYVDDTDSGGPAAFVVPLED